MSSFAWFEKTVHIQHRWTLVSDGHFHDARALLSNGISFCTETTKRPWDRDCESFHELWALLLSGIPVHTVRIEIASPSGSVPSASLAMRSHWMSLSSDKANKFFFHDFPAEFQPFFLSFVLKHNKIQPIWCTFSNYRNLAIVAWKTNCMILAM